MQITPTEIPDVKRVTPATLSDGRGDFFESWRANRLEEAGIGASFVQENCSRSGRGVLRGLHYQITRPQGKLINVTVGKVFDVVVDLRKSSATFGRWVGITLSDDKPTLIWAPPGFAHGFYVISDSAEFVYRCTDYYSPKHERTIRWDDPILAIDWPLSPNLSPLLSEKDRAASLFENAEYYE